MSNKIQNTNFFKRAIELLHSARQQVVRQVNLTMVQTYFEIGKMIVVEEQEGKDRIKNYKKHALN